MQPTTLAELSEDKRQKIRDFLMGHPVGVLATVDEHGNPNASTIYYGVDASLDVTFTTKQDTGKHRNIMGHDTVMLVAYDSETQSAVQLSGKATPETDAAVAQSIYHSTLHAATQTGEDNVPPIAKIAAGAYIAYRIKPDNVWMVEYGWGDTFKNAMDHAAEPSDSKDPD